MHQEFKDAGGLPEKSFKGNKGWAILKEFMDPAWLFNFGKGFCCSQGTQRYRWAIQEDFKDPRGLMILLLTGNPKI